MVPPGMPKTTSAPTASSERTSDWAPVTLTGVPAGGAGFGRAPGTPGAVGPGFASLRDVALVIGLCLVGLDVSLVRVRIRRWSWSWATLCPNMAVSEHQKTPADREVARGSRVDAAETS
ncbi:hypothetical protein GCM10023192_55860 [Amycolatopsis samaneae]